MSHKLYWLSSLICQDFWVMINGMVFDIGPFLRDEADKTVGKCWGRFYMCATCKVGMSTLLRRKDESQGVSTWESHGISIPSLCLPFTLQARYPKMSQVLNPVCFQDWAKAKHPGGKAILLRQLELSGSWEMMLSTFQRILVTEWTEDWNRCWWSLCSPDILGGVCNTRHVVAAMCCFL